jgi:hypothetical protein
MTETEADTQPPDERENNVEPTLTDTGKMRKIKAKPTSVPGIAITSPASMTVLAYDRAGNPAGQIELAPGHASKDRMDLIFQTSEGNPAALKGEEADAGGDLPVPPPTPQGSVALANVYIKAGTTSLDEFSVTPPHNTGVYELDLNDEFEYLLSTLIDLQRRKRADYANAQNLYNNFDVNSANMDLPGYTPFEDCKSMVLRKLGRINNLRGRDPQNEAVQDSVRDAVVYTILMYGLFMRDGR